MQPPVGRAPGTDRRALDSAAPRLGLDGSGAHLERYLDVDAEPVVAPPMPAGFTDAAATQIGAAAGPGGALRFSAARRR